MMKKVIAILISALIGVSFCNIMPVKAADAELPSSVDLSADLAFPCIGNQGSINSCVAWATTYYQFTYEVNKLRGTVARKIVNNTYVNIEENVYSPAWTYNYCNSGGNNTISSDGAYVILSNQGAMTIDDMPYDKDNYSFTAWSTDIAKMTEALEYRAVLNVKQKYTLDDTHLNAVKEMLASGHVGVVSTSIKGWVIKENDDGENIVICSSAGGGHAMAVVGYDDDIEITVNGATLKGAFKLANSYGTDLEDHNDGFIWVAYDALYDESTSSINWEDNQSTDELNTRDDRDYSSAIRTAAFGSVYRFCFIDVCRYNITFAGYVEYESNCNDVYLYADGGTNADTGVVDYRGSASSDSHTKKILVFDYFKLDGYSGVYEGDSYDMSNCLSSNWTVKIIDSQRANRILNFRTKVIDNFGNVIAPNADNFTELENYKASITTTVNLAKGRISAYDNAEITETDADMLLSFLTLKIELSNVQAYLADYNSDGVVSMVDLVQMNSYIEAQNGGTYAITDYVDRWGCSLADIIEEQYDMPIEQYVAQNYAELSAMNVIPADMSVSAY